MWKIKESLSESRVCQSDDLKRTLGKMHFSRFPQTCSITLLNVFPSNPGCGHFLPVCERDPPPSSWTLSPRVSIQSSVVTFFYLEFNGTSSKGGRATVLHCFCNEMLLYCGKIQTSATETFVAIIKQTAVQVEKKTCHFVNKNSLSYPLWLILTILLPQTGSHMM